MLQVGATGINQPTMKAYGGMDVYIHIFLTPTLVGGEWSASRSGLFTHGVPVTLWIGGLVGLRTGTDDVEKRKFLILPGLELRPLGRPSRRQSLYRLRYPGSLYSANKGNERYVENFDWESSSDNRWVLDKV
jgi:hypothetical protein